MSPEMQSSDSVSTSSDERHGAPVNDYETAYETARSDIGLISRTQRSRTAMVLAPTVNGPQALAQAPAATLADLGLAIRIINFYGVSSARGRPRYWLLLFWIVIFACATFVSALLVRRLQLSMHAKDVASPVPGAVGVCAGFIIGVISFQALHQWQTPQNESPQPTAWRRRAQARRRLAVVSRFSPRDSVTYEYSVPDRNGEDGYGPAFAGCIRFPGSGTLLLNEMVALASPTDALRVFTYFSFLVLCAGGLLGIPLLYLSDIFILQDRDTTYGEATAIVLARMMSTLLPLIPIVGIVSTMFGAPLAFVVRIRAIVDELRLRTATDHATFGLSSITYEIGALYEMVELMNARMSAIVGVSTLVLLVAVAGQLLFFLLNESRRLGAVLSLASFLIMFVVCLSPFAVLNTQLGLLQTAVLTERGEIAMAENIESGRLETLVAEFDSLLQFTTSYRGGAKVGGIPVTVGLMKAVVIGAVSFVSAIYTLVE